MINNSKSTEKFIKKNTNQLRLKLQNKYSKAETKFAIPLHGIGSRHHARGRCNGVVKTTC